jgi:hypothetical protein
MTNDEYELVTFENKWRHWGGAPDEDIFVAFGISPLQYYDRLDRLLHNPRQLGILDFSPQVVNQLREVCKIKLASHKNPRTRHTTSAA